MATACTTSAPRPSTTGQVTSIEEGLASWYGHPYHGRPTASGVPYDMANLTAAHPTLPFGTAVRVTNLVNGRSVVVTINDRGPFIAGRVLDLSYAAAERLDAIGAGVIPVRLEVIAFGDGMVGERCWEVQVGAFATPENLNRAIARLRQSGLPHRTVPAPGGLTRVRVTNMSSRAQAVATAAQLQGQFPGAAAVPCGGGQ